MAKEKTKDTKKLASDIVWCKNNVKTLRPITYFKQFNITDRRDGHTRYKQIITTYVNKRYKKKLVEEFDLWRKGVESDTFWSEQLKIKSRSEADFYTTQFTTSQVRKVYKQLTDMSSESSLSSEEEPRYETEEDLDENSVGSNLPFLTEDLDNMPSFVSDDKHPDADNYYWCLQGGGSELWRPSPTTRYPDWVVKDINITEEFKEIRVHSYSAAYSLERISNIRILTLSHIFNISPQIERSITSLIPAVHEDLLLETDFFRRVETPMEITQWAHRIHEAQATDMSRILSEMMRFSLNSDNPLLQKHFDFLDDFIKFYRAPHSNDTEDSALDRLKMVLRHIFYENKYIINSNTKHLESSKDYIPDFKLSYTARTTKLMDLFIVEAKLSNKSYFPNQDDFIKLRLEMQKMLNDLISLNVAQPMVFGLILKGLDCQLYAMWLKHDGVYISREIQTFSLPRSSYEVLLCPSILSTLLAVKDKIDNIIQRIQIRGKGKSSLIGLTRTGYDAPVLVKDPLSFHDTVEDDVEPDVESDD